VCQWGVERGIAAGEWVGAAGEQRLDDGGVADPGGMAEQRQRGRAADDAAEVGADGIDDPIEVRAAAQRREDENLLRVGVEGRRLS
jgi:hypothetical protein